MKIIAMFLPQFHRTRENDEWWGEGFTEWTAVKQASPLYNKHRQPRVPQYRNYYNLLDKDTVVKQAQLAREYGVDGFCFYHYWFKDGRRILEKPVENLLAWTDIDLPFCFSWANEAWARTWHNLNDKNSWAQKFEHNDQLTSNETGLLLEQKYGERRDWKEHFEYLLPFFKDKRYIKINNEPIFMFYKPELIPCLSDMLQYWDQLAKEAGLEGIFTIGSNIFNKSNTPLKAIYIHEPQATVTCRFAGETLSRQRDNVKEIFDYDELWNNILRRRYSDSHKIFLGGFVDYDDTPRRGLAGSVVEGSSPEKFQRYLTGLLKKSDSMQNELVFINAWNEWGESMYLEPDEENQYKYLKAVREAKSTYKAMEIKTDRPSNHEQKISEDYDSLEKTNSRYRSYWKVLNQWLTLKEDGKSLDRYLLKRGIHTIAIYGIGMLGLHLVKELHESEVQIIYGIDQNGDMLHAGFPIYTIAHELEQVDAVIVTATYDFSDIKRELESKISFPIISLEEVIFES